MYKYLINTNSKSKIDHKTNLIIAEKLKKNRIYSDPILFSGEKELSSLLLNFKKQNTNTLVVIGDDEDFNLFIGQIGKLDDDIAIGYLPLSKSPFSKYLGIGSIQEGVNALAQRKINEKTIYSVSSRYFIDTIDITFNSLENKKAIITTDKNIELKIPESIIRIENIDDENYLSKTPLQIRAYKKLPETTNRTIKSPFLKNIFRPLKEDNDLKRSLILSIHARSYRINSPVKISDSFGREYPQSITVGRQSKIIRLISKKPEMAK